MTQPGKPADAEIVRLAMRQWATGVTVVTSQLAGRRHGMTVNAFTSISLSPPLLLVSLEQNTRTNALVRQAGIFGVTILDAGQQMISDRFAGRLPVEDDQFAGLEPFTLVTGAPFLPDGLAWFDCQVTGSYDAGDHSLYLGQVTAAQFREDGGSPLIYYARAYWNLQG